MDHGRSDSGPRYPRQQLFLVECAFAARDIADGNPSLLVCYPSVHDQPRINWVMAGVHIDEVASLSQS